MIFYDCSTAPSPRRARIFIAEKGIEIDTRDVSIARGEQLGDAFRAINPDATLPVLITDAGSTLTENLAIAVYLEEMFPTPPLLGTTPDDKAEIFMWNAICEAQGGHAVAEALRNSNPHMKNRALTGPVNYEQIPALAERGIARIGRFFDRLEARLEGRDHIAANQLSLADISGFVFVDFARVVKQRVTDTHPNLLRWYEAMKTRPSTAL